jgi:D-alanine-D-alanine ligase
VIAVASGEASLSRVEHSCGVAKLEASPSSGILPPFPPLPSDVPRFATSHAKWNDAYRKKWGITNGAARELMPEVEGELRKIARNVYGWLKIRGCGRMDFRLTLKGELFVIEANPNPSLSQDEDFAQSAAADGMDYDALITAILSLATSGSSKLGPVS